MKDRQLAPSPPPPWHPATPSYQAVFCSNDFAISKLLVALNILDVPPVAEIGEVVLH